MGRWIKGQSGNMKGRPKSNDVSVLQAMCRSYLERSFEELERIISDPNTRDYSKIKAIQLMWEYGYGKPKQVVAIEKAVDVNALKEMSSVDLFNRIAEIEHQGEPISYHIGETEIPVVEKEVVEVKEVIDVKPKRAKRLNKAKGVKNE